MANLLCDLGDLGVHRLLMGCHSIELRRQLINRCTKSFISLSLSRNELLYETFQA